MRSFLRVMAAVAVLAAALPAAAATVSSPTRPVRLLCKVIATSNLTLSGAQTIDSVSVVAGDIACAVAQNDNKNGAYQVGAGAWKALDPGMGTGLELYALLGSTNANKVYGADTTGAITWGTTAVTFTLKSSSGSAFDPSAAGAVTGTTITGNTALVSKVIDIPDNLGSNPTPTVGHIKLFRTTTGDFLNIQAGTGDGLTVGNLSASGTSRIDTRFYAKSLADDATFDLAIPNGGHGRLTAVGSGTSVSCAFSMATDGTTSDNGLTGTSCAVADVDTKLCAYKGASNHVIFKNRLGSTLTVLIELAFVLAP